MFIIIIVSISMVLVVAFYDCLFVVVISTAISAAMVISHIVTISCDYAAKFVAIATLPVLWELRD